MYLLFTYLLFVCHSSFFFFFFNDTATTEIYTLSLHDALPILFDYGIDRFTSERTGDAFHTMIVARRYGDGVFPVEIQVTYQDGQQSRWTWDGRDRWKGFQTDGPARAVSAEVDPRRVLLLGVNRTNNSASLSPAGPRAARKWSLVWLVWLQNQLLTDGFFV